MSDVRAAEVSASAEDSGLTPTDVDCAISGVGDTSGAADVDVSAAAWAVVAEVAKASRVGEDGVVVSGEAEVSSVVLSEVSAVVVSSPVWRVVEVSAAAVLDADEIT